MKNIHRIPRRKSILFICLVCLATIGQARAIELNSGNISTYCGVGDTYCDLYNQGITHIDADTFVNHTNLDSLNLNSNQLSSIDLSLLTGLEDLKLNSNQLSSIDLNGLTSLYFLEMNNNQLSGIDLSGLTSLSFLELNGNQLSSIDLSGLPALSSLEMANNQLSSIDLSGLTNLFSLDFSSNQLISIDLNGLTGLSFLDLHDNQLSSIDLSGLTKMSHIILDHNQLTNINLSGQTVTYLYLNNNQITNVSLFGLTGLEHLYLNNNNISSINNLTFEGLNKLYSFYLNYNHITSIGSGDFRGLTGLSNLYLDNNEITSIGTGISLPSLRYFLLENNNITGINNGFFDSLTGLLSLNMSANKLSNIDSGDFKGLENLNYLNLSSNDITSIETGSFDDLSSLDTIEIVNNYLVQSRLPSDILNKILSLNSGVFPRQKSVYGCMDPLANNYNENATQNDSSCVYSIGELNSGNISIYCDVSSTECDLSNHGVTSIARETFVNHTNLIRLYLGYNEITNIDSGAFLGLGNLKRLRLSDNKISDLTNLNLERMVGLEYLYIDLNQITFIDKTTFSGLNNLKRLYIAANPISEIPDGTFSGLNNLEELDIGTLKIKKITPGLFEGLGSSLDTLYMSDYGDYYPEDYPYPGIIEEIEPGSFDNLTGLGYVDFYGNMIHKMPSNIFENLPNLSYSERTLANNCIDTATIFTYYGTQLTGWEGLQKVCPVISYDPTTTTSGPVTGTILFTGGSAADRSTLNTNNPEVISHRWIENGSFMFDLNDISDSGLLNTKGLFLTGNVARIATSDSISPVGTISYSTTGYTSGNVLATITLNEPGSITNNGGNTGYLFTGNGTFAFSFQDLASNTGESTASVTWIDKTSPTIMGVVSGGTYISSATFTVSDNNLVSLVSLDGNSLSSGISYTVSSIGTHILNVSDVAGNSTAVTFSVVAQQSGGGGGGGTIKSKDICPNGDYTDSLYDKKCGDKPNSESTGESKIDSGYTNPVQIPLIEDIIKVLPTGRSSDDKNELAAGYQFALKNNITTVTQLDKIYFDGLLTREQMAKMISNYISNVIGTSNTKYSPEECSNFSDIGSLSKEMKGYVILSCQLGIMGQDGKGSMTDKFRPYEKITRAQFGTILSRVFRGDKYESNGDRYYVNHLKQLKQLGVMKKTENPDRINELRGWTMVMLKRSKDIIVGK